MYISTGEMYISIWRPPALDEPLSGPSGSHQPSSFLLLVTLPFLSLPIFSEYLSKLPSLLYRMVFCSLTYSATTFPIKPIYFLLSASKLESILMLASSWLILLINAGKLLPIIISKFILGFIHFKSIQSI